MKIGTCAIEKEEVIYALETEATIILATCADNRVTIRPMSHVNNGLTVFFQTGRDYLKVRQIRQNPFVAICVGTYEIEGTATLLGHPLADENRFFVEKLKVKHPGAYERWSACEDEVVIKVDIHRVSQWRYIGGEPFLAEMNCEGADDHEN